MFFETRPFDFGVGASVSSASGAGAAYESGFDNLLQASLSWGFDVEDIIGTLGDFEHGVDNDGQWYLTVTLLGFNFRVTSTRTRIGESPKYKNDDDGAPNE